MPKLCYFQVPNFDINPDSGTAPKLGSIFANLDRLTGPLNQDDHVDIPPNLMNQTSSSFKETVDKSIGVTAGLNANIVQGLAGSGELVYAFSRNKQDTYQCELLETLEFEPNDQLVTDSILASQRVQNFLQDSLLGLKRVYMITGLKIATGFSRSSSKEIQNGPKLKVGVDATAFGIPVSAGPQLDLTVGTARTTSHGRSTTKIVFAYRAIKIRRKRDGNVAFKHRGGGKYDLNDESSDSDDSDGEDEDKWNIEPISQEDRGEEFTDSNLVTIV
ncbi:hypothetical protein BGZ61DRAFT_395512 [Ilyonectria robusta]|uniref:uncharacterized protein n=1 Tax=Ilyonectria robusta TaxID=1079257 RepID=UPI001E8E27C3|nr:uncharacterized protein BGZ61DRAFT_395512 [Ilyonectria robusta]KAH8680262.1 hypothetical protein BGZ61DRAFT_395512 [Ilyonectria robusta]